MYCDKTGLIKKIGMKKESFVKWNYMKKVNHKAIETKEKFEKIMQKAKMHVCVCVYFKINKDTTMSKFNCVCLCVDVFCVKWQKIG